MDTKSKEPMGIDELFSLMEKYNIESYEHEGHKVTRKSLDILREENSLKQAEYNATKKFSEG